jgi:hypothetical protein
MTTPRLVAHRGFGAPTKGTHRRAQQHPSQTRNTWIRQIRPGIPLVREKYVPNAASRNGGNVGGG